MITQFKVYIRPLKAEDASISWKWRNDIDIWKYTESRPTKVITEQIERAWVEKTLLNSNQRRFAICLFEDHRYIGNAQLLNINNLEAEFHIFIGDKMFWGKGYGKEASILLLNYGFNELGLKRILLKVNDANEAAVKLYKGLGFKTICENLPMNFLVEMSLDKVDFKHLYN